MFRWRVNRCKTFFVLLFLAAGGASVASLRGDDPPDAFLDRPFPASIELTTSTSHAPDGKPVTSSMLGVPSFWKGVELLGAMSGKKVSLRAGLGEWPDERSEINWQGTAFGAGDRSTVRTMFESLCFSLDMVWRFDAEQNMIILDPRWWHADPRPGQELIDVLLERPPVSSTKLPWGGRNRVGGLDQILDDWRVAFDALLSRPENLPAAGTLRLYHDTHGPAGIIFSGLVTNLYTGKITDDHGHRQIVVLNVRYGIDSKSSAGDVAYYLFDEDGRFTKGGVFSVAEKHTGYIRQIVATDDRDIIVVLGLGRFALPSSGVRIRFALEAGDLVLRGSTDDTGEVRDALQTQTAFPDVPEGPIQQKFSVSAKRGD